MFVVVEEDMRLARKRLRQAPSRKLRREIYLNVNDNHQHSPWLYVRRPLSHWRGACKMPNHQDHLPEQYEHLQAHPVTTTSSRSRLPQWLRQCTIRRLLHQKKGEKALMKQGIMPIGSRRRRAAIKSSDNIPFEQLPFQCFQEARKVLQADREEKLKLIATERLRISNLKALDASNIKGGEIQKERKLDSMRRYLEYLKIQADMNDPLIKKRFEDGEGTWFTK